jgi:uncharacterized protein (DUF4415 family)
MKGKHTKTAHSEALAAAREAMTPDMRAELEAAAALPDEDINTDDIPEVRNWSGAVRGRFYRPVKRRLTLRIDADVIAYFQQESPDGGYQTAMNRVLRAAMLRGLRRRTRGPTGSTAA